MYFQEIKEYFYTLRYYIIFSFLIFLLAAFAGYFFAQNYSEGTEKILKEVGAILEPVGEMSIIEQLFFIFFNNAFTGFLAILLGVVLGIFPFFCLFGNGEILGILAFFTSQKLSLSTFFVGILPHGIIEIPVLILVCASGIRIGKVIINKLFRGKGEAKKELSLALIFFLKILLPFLFLAAIIETFITPQFLPEVPLTLNFSEGIYFIKDKVL
jgi:stage II sporulation protein M